MRQRATSTAGSCANVSGSSGGLRDVLSKREIPRQAAVELQPVNVEVRRRLEAIKQNASGRFCVVLVLISRFLLFFTLRLASSPQHPSCLETSNISGQLVLIASFPQTNCLPKRPTASAIKSATRRPIRGRGGSDVIPQPGGGGGRCSAGRPPAVCTCQH